MFIVNFSLTYHGSGSNNTDSPVPEKHNIALFQLINNVHFTAKCRYATILHHIPYFIFIISAIRIEQNTPLMSRVDVPIVWRREEFEKLLSPYAIQPVG